MSPFFTTISTRKLSRQCVLVCLCACVCTVSEILFRIVEQCGLHSLIFCKSRRKVIFKITFTFSQSPHATSEKVSYNKGRMCQFILSNKNPTIVISVGGYNKIYIRRSLSRKHKTLKYDISFPTSNLGLM